MTNANGDNRRRWIEWSFPAALALLLGFSLYGSFFPRTDPVKRQLTETLLGQIEFALEDYRSHHGLYPIHRGDSRDGGPALWKALRDNPSSDWKSIFRNHASLNVIAVVNDAETLVDAWGNPIFYRCEPPAKQPAGNPVYELSSTGNSPDNPPEDWIFTSTESHRFPH